MMVSNAWNTNGTLASTTEGYGPNVAWGTMKWFTQNFGYDNINRLTSAGDAGYSRGFSYDSYGNMAVSSGTLLSGVTPSSVGGNNPYNLATNQLLAASYDADGQAKTLGNPAAVNFTYDAEGRVTWSQSNNSPAANVAVTYYYDGEGEPHREGGDGRDDDGVCA